MEEQTDKSLFISITYHSSNREFFVHEICVQFPPNSNSKLLSASNDSTRLLILLFV